MHFVYFLIFLLSAYKWGDWKNWRLYYPSILFFAIGDLLQMTIFHNYHLWEYKESIFGQRILFSHKIINLMVILLEYPSTTLIFLGHLPKTFKYRALWIAFWVFCYGGIEFINLHYLHLINHYHGWNIIWSFVFNMGMFSILAVHFKKPLLAWCISLLWILFLWNALHIPLRILK